MDLQSLIPEISQNESISSFVSDEDEEALLTDLEATDQGSTATTKHPLARLAKSSIMDEREPEEDGVAPIDDPPQLDEEAKALIRRRFSTWMEEVSQSRLEFSFNLASVLMNARAAKQEWKQRGLDAILHKSKGFGDILRKFFLLLYPDRKDLKFKAGWTALYAELHIADRMVGDPFLLNVLRSMKGKAKNDDERLRLLNLLLCCGDDVSREILDVLKRANRLDVTFAVYVRIVVIYYFRYHRDVDRKDLRNLLKEIRVADKSRCLPVV